MRINIPYGKNTIRVNIDKNYLEEVIYPSPVDRYDEIQLIQQALETPVSGQSFDDFIDGNDEIFVIVNDAARPTNTTKVLDVIFPKLVKHKVKFLIASGTHPSPTENELESIFGPHLHAIRNNIYKHDSKNNENMIYVGTSTKGTRINLNRLVVNAKNILVIGSVEPHYYAGFTGGRKSFLPGVASYHTIEKNHSHAMQETAQPLKLCGNPVHEDMEECLNFLHGKNIFSIMLVQDCHDYIYSVSSGDIKASFREAVKDSTEIYGVKVEKKAGIVVAVVNAPLDQDLYQSHKAVEHAKLAVNEGGILILVSECCKGIGPDHFVRILSKATDLDDALNEICGNYFLGNHKVNRIVQFLQSNEIWAVTALSSDIIKSIFFRPFSSIQEALDQAIHQLDQKVLFLMNAGIVVPILDK